MGYSQQDAQEFLRYLLEGLHEDVNRVTVKPKPIMTDIDDSLRYDSSSIRSLFKIQVLQCAVTTLQNIVLIFLFLPISFFFTILLIMYGRGSVVIGTAVSGLLELLAIFHALLLLCTHLTGRV